MEDTKKWQERVWSDSQTNFEALALELFFHQAKNNILYNNYLQAINCSWKKISSIDEMPFLPIRFFKTHEIKTGNWKPEVLYTSSGTGGDASRHAVESESRYLQNAEKIFTQFFGSFSNYHFLALLPSYLERKGSSLISMLNYFMEKSQSKHSGFYLYNVDELINKIESLKGNRKIMLWGVTYSLLDLAEKGNFDWSDCLILETGGMKGQRAEITRGELHQKLKQQFNVKNILSEYGMTELLSQAYSMGDGIFKNPPWMKICVRDIYDPFQKLSNGKGRVCVIDLANIHSCAFIETQDAGLLYDDGSFELIGRIDNADIRGCNLMVQ